MLSGVGEPRGGSGEARERELVETAFRELERNWVSDDAHRRFIALCAARGALGDAGRRYRHVRESDPARSDDAARRLQQVTAAALEQLARTRSARPPRSRRAMWLMVGVCGFIVIQAVLALLRARSQ